MSEVEAMTSTEGFGEQQGIELLRQDKRGRVRVPKERRESLLAAYDRSGMSGAEFAEWAGIKYPTFMGWVESRRRQKKDMVGKSAEGVSWVEAVVNDDRRDLCVSNTASDSGGLVIELSGGARMRVKDVAGAGLAAEVLRGLGGVGC